MKIGHVLLLGERWQKPRRPVRAVVSAAVEAMLLSPAKARG
jgi:hypothetical protein